MQLCGGGTQGLGAVLPDIRYDFVVDVLHDALQIVLQMSGGIAQLLLPRAFRLFGRHSHTSSLSIRCWEKRRVNVDSMRFRSCANVVTPGLDTKKRSL